jgi:hypothetical protein
MAKRFVLGKHTNEFGSIFGLWGWRVVCSDSSDPLTKYIRRRYNDYANEKEAQADADHLNALDAAPDKAAFIACLHDGGEGINVEKAQKAAIWKPAELSPEQEAKRSELFNQYCDQGMSEEAAWNKANDEVWLDVNIPWLKRKETSNGKA